MSVNRALDLLLRESQLNVRERKFAEILVFLNEKDQTAMCDYLKRNYLGRTPAWVSLSNRDASGPNDDKRKIPPANQRGVLPPQR
ncbi:unnamed protein product [Heligmosomoides polygyrus]|uniref:CARD domain-containing protein n=1 Tax=Heligmosomoides polygyrus TaxID=6339 RepID=A0A183F5P1_HELPZ|nr:unnamed protein product [Heligmosomoides polygyrus]